MRLISQPQNLKITKEDFMIKKNKQQDEFINKISLKERLGKKELTKIKKANT